MKSKEFLFNTEFLETLYQQYLDNKPLSDEWIKFFDGVSDKPKVQNKNVQNIFVKTIESSSSIKHKVLRLIDSYRKMGHYLCNLDPLNIESPKKPADLGLELKDFEIEDEAIVCDIASYAFDFNLVSVKQILKQLQNVYGASVGVEFENVQDLKEKSWLYKEFENLSNLSLDNDVKKKLLNYLIKTEEFEGYLSTKFPGLKRFSIEGSESVIVVAKVFAKYCIDNPDISELIVGMSHRGRIALLAQIAHKPYCKIFSEFTYEPERNTLDLIYSADVKYHVGYSDEENKFCKVHILNNPSHLESINPIAAGVVCAKNKQVGPLKQVASLAIHGDGAFCGQGVVAETLAMTRLNGYKTSGTIHLIVNNQIGFTADSKELHASRYPTEFAKIAQIPILHVNGEDIESLYKAIQLAIKYKDTFNKDIVIDIFGYRKHGHNEGDEPAYTQGYMYNIIKNKLPISKIYASKLIEQKIINDDFVQEIKLKFKNLLDSEFNKIAKPSYKSTEIMEMVETVPGYNLSELKRFATQIFSYPKDFAIHPKLIKLFEQKLKNIQEEQIDWATAENLAFASLLSQGVNIRLSGQDAARGTFSQRHSVLDSQTQMSTTYVPLNNLSDTKGIKYSSNFEVYNSFLSEFAVLGFEYGYAFASSNDLVIWEAQFGDFANGGQIVFDQYISSSHSKWRQASALVTLLPHGFEGQGPEHSSARIERFLSLAAQNNLQISLCSTPASYFHLLRRQILQKNKKPLIVFTPKSLLRHKLATSPLSDLDENNTFQKVIDEHENLTQVDRIILCSGKVYYDLIEYRTKKDIKNVAIIRLEQYYPFPEKELLRLLKKYNNACKVILCQEEPKNMGAFYFIYPRMLEIFKELSCNMELIYAGRGESASPACGYSSWHKQEQDLLIQQALGH